MNWREILSISISEVAYAKAAKAPGEPECNPLLQLLHTGSSESSIPNRATLDQVSPDAAGIPWAEWKAAALNRLFQEHGTSGQPGRITAETVRHGERLARGQGLPPERS